MSSKLKLKHDATFKHSVQIPVAGGDFEKVVLEFRSKTQKELNAFVEKISTYDTDTDMLMDFVVGWDVVETFSRDNLDVLLDNYIGSGSLILKSYLNEIGKARLGN